MGFIWFPAFIDFVMLYLFHCWWLRRRHVAASRRFLHFAISLLPLSIISPFSSPFLLYFSTDVSPPDAFHDDAAYIFAAMRFIYWLLFTRDFAYDAALFSLMTPPSSYVYAGVADILFSFWDALRQQALLRYMPLFTPLPRDIFIDVFYIFAITVLFTLHAIDFLSPLFSPYSLIFTPSHAFIYIMPFWYYAYALFAILAYWFSLRRASSLRLTLPPMMFICHFFIFHYLILPSFHLFTLLEHAFLRRLRWFSPHWCLFAMSLFFAIAPALYWCRRFSLMRYCCPPTLLRHFLIIFSLFMRWCHTCRLALPYYYGFFFFCLVWWALTLSYYDAIFMPLSCRSPAFAIFFHFFFIFFRYFFCQMLIYYVIDILPLRHWYFPSYRCRLPLDMALEPPGLPRHAMRWWFLIFFFVTFLPRLTVVSSVVSWYFQSCHIAIFCRFHLFHIIMPIIFHASPSHLLPLVFLSQKRARLLH